MPSSQTPLPSDPLAALVDGEAQRRAAHLAQEAFARVFRLSVAEPDDVRRRGVEQLRGELAEWAGQAADDEARALRLALLLAGMDQWGDRKSVV